MRVKTPTKIFAKPGEKSPMQKPKEIKRRNIKFAFLPLSSIHIDVSNSTIQDFSFLERFSRLASIDARNTLIQNVQSAPLRPLIEYISLDDSPITMQPFYRLMLLCTIGNQIQSIDGVSVTNEEKEQGKKLLPVIQKYLYDGYTIKSIDPLVVIRGETEIEIDPETGEKLSDTEIKINQTTIIIEEFAKQVNEVKSEMGLDNKEVVVEEIMKSPKKVDYSPYLSPSKFHVEPPPEEISPFKKAFNKHLSPKDYLKANDIYNSPEKRRETQMEITTMMESHGILSDEIDLLATPRHQQDNEIPSELHIDTQLEEEDLGEAEIIPASAENADLIDTTKSAADIFEAASVITSPHKAMDLARKSQKAKSKIPTRIKSPVKDVYEDKCIMPPLSPVLKSIVMEEDDQDIAAKEEEFRRELRFFPSPRASRKRDSFINEDETLNDQNNEEENNETENHEEEAHEEDAHHVAEEKKETENHEEEEKKEEIHEEEDAHHVEEEKKETENQEEDVHHEEEEKKEEAHEENIPDETIHEEEDKKEETHEEEQKETENHEENVPKEEKKEDDKNEEIHHEEEEKKESENQEENVHEEEQKKDINEEEEKKEEVSNEKVEETKEIEIHEGEEKIEDAHPEEEQNKEDTHGVDENKENAREEEDKKEIENAAADGDDKIDEVHREEEEKEDEISNEEEAEKENIQEQDKNENHEEEQKEQTIINEENKVNADHEQEDEKNEVHEEEEKKENENHHTEEQTEDKKESVNESAEQKREENETHDEEEKKEIPEAVDEVSNEEKPTNEEEVNSDNKESTKEDNENLNHEDEKMRKSNEFFAEVEQKDDNETQEAASVEVEKAHEEEDNKENVMNEKADAEEKNNNDDEQGEV